MANLEPDGPVTLHTKTVVAVLFMSGCCFAVGFLLIWGRI